MPITRMLEALFEHLRDKEIKFTVKDKRSATAVTSSKF